MPSQTDNRSNMSGGLITKRLVMFRPDREGSFDPWANQFEALNDKPRGWNGIMTGKLKVPTKAEYDAALRVEEGKRSEDQKSIIIRYQANVDCYNQMILSMDISTTQGRLAYHLVRTCKKKDDYPEGNCNMAYEKLVSKYAPKNTQSELTLRRKFANYRLRDGEDPDEFLMKLETTAMDINAMESGTSDITDMDIMSQALCNLPASYDAIVDGLERQLEASGDEKLTIDKLREKLNARYVRLAKLEEVDEDGPETALMAIQKFKKKFKGTCYRCGKRGHKSTDCDQRKKNEDEKAKQNEDEQANVATEDTETDEEEELCF